MTTGGAQGPVDSPPDEGRDESSTPWERAQLWQATETPSLGIDAPEPETSAGELIARLSAESAAPRRRRHADETAAVSAADLIAALSGPTAMYDATQAAPGLSGSGGETGPAGAEGVSPDQDPGAASAGSAAQPENNAQAQDMASAEGEGQGQTTARTVSGDLAENAGAAAGMAPAGGSQPGSAGPVINMTETGGDQPWQQVLAALEAEPPAHADRPHRGWLAAGRSLVAVLAVLLLVASGTEWVIKMRADAALAAGSVSALEPQDSNISPPVTEGPGPSSQDVAAPVIPKSYQAENTLILGSDSRMSAADQKLGGKDDSPGGSDVVMIAHLSADRSHITIVSIPRDTYIEAPSCKAWDHETGKQLDQDYTTPYSMWRINATYAAGGPPCTVKAVQQLTGLKIDRVIIIDFAGFKAMVDALGGIDVNVCAPIIDSNLGTVIKRAGEQHINGKQALRLVRARHVEGDTTSDLARIRRQQKVLSTILRQVTSAGVLLNPVKLDAVLQAFVRNVQSDNVTMDSLLDIAQSLGNLDPKRVTFFTLPTVPDSNGVGLHPTENSDLIWRALRADKPLPGEVTDTPSTTATTPMTTITPDPVTELQTQLVTTTPTGPQQISVAPRDVDLQVVNVAGRGGVASTAMKALTPLGYRLAGPDLLLITDDTRSAITVEYAPANRAAAVTVAASVPGATLVPVSGLGDKVRLMLGSSFDGTVRAVQVGDPVPARLSTAAEPVVSTVVSTAVSTPPPIVTLAPTPTTTTPTSTVELTSVNAGDAGCI